MHWGDEAIPRDGLLEPLTVAFVYGLRLLVEVESNSIRNNVWTHISATFPTNATTIQDAKFYINGAHPPETDSATVCRTLPVWKFLIGNDHSVAAYRRGR